MKFIRKGGRIIPIGKAPYADVSEGASSMSKKPSGDKITRTFSQKVGSKLNGFMNKFRTIDSGKMQSSYMRAKGVDIANKAGSKLTRRINGRIIPIKKKLEEVGEVKNVFKKTSRKDIPAIATIGAGFGVSVGGGYQAGKVIRNSWNAYRSASHLRGEIKVLKSIRPNINPAFLYKESAKFKLAGKALATKGFGLLAVSGLIGSSIAGYGAYKYLDKKTDSTKAFSVASTIGAVASGAGIAIFARKAKVKHLISALKGTGKTTGVDARDIAKAWSRYGENRSRATIKKYSDIASSGQARSEYSHKISKTISQLKKLSTKNKNIDPNQGKLF